MPELGKRKNRDYNFNSLKRCGRVGEIVGCSAAGLGIVGTVNAIYNAANGCGSVVEVVSSAGLILAGGFCGITSYALRRVSKDYQEYLNGPTSEPIAKEGETRYESSGKTIKRKLANHVCLVIDSTNIKKHL